MHQSNARHDVWGLLYTLQTRRAGIVDPAQKLKNNLILRRLILIRPGLSLSIFGSPRELIGSLPKERERLLYFWISDGDSICPLGTNWRKIGGVMCTGFCGPRRSPRALPV